jgi:uncharacterized protein (DUF362 family)
VKVAVVHDPTLRYPDSPPFHPEQWYAELRPYRGWPASARPNPVYRWVRDGLLRLGLDRENAGTPDWNPLRGIVRRGDRVVIKPNLVLHEPPHLVDSCAVFTHGSVLRPLIDYVLLASDGDCRLTIADCPLQEADLSRVTQANGLDRLLAFYREELGFPIDFIDFRLDRMILRHDGRIESRGTAPGDPRGNVTVRLDRESELEAIAHEGDRFGSAYQQAFAVALYDPQRTANHHRPGRHEYLIPRTILESDVFLNVPKLKTHQKAGITVCLKNLIGINADKSYLPHYREGSLEEGGDEYPYRDWLTSINRRLRGNLVERGALLWGVTSRTWRLLRRHVLTPRILGRDSRTVVNLGIGGGAWHGNDTLWRTILDINTILFFADATGRVHDAPQRRYFALVDGIVAGEGNGPILPTPKACGVLLLGADPLAVDVVASRLMGLAWERIPKLRAAAARRQHRFSTFSGDVSTIAVVSNDARWERLFEQAEHLDFVPPPSWDTIRLARGHPTVPQVA